eukprot:s117_g16.t1
MSWHIDSYRFVEFTLVNAASVAVPSKTILFFNAGWPTHVRNCTPRRCHRTGSEALSTMSRGCGWAIEQKAPTPVRCAASGTEAR